MVRRIFALLALVCLLSVHVICLADVGMVNDQAGLYTENEISAMEEIIARIRGRYQMDAVVLTTNDVPYAYGDDSVTVRYADAWYEDNGFGLGADRAGVLLIMDMNNRFNYMSTAGVMIDYMSDSRIDRVLSAADDYLAESRYGRAMIAELQRLESFCAQGIEEGNFRYDEVTGQRLTGLYNKLTRGEAVFGGFCGLGVAGIFWAVVMGRYKLSGGTYNYKLAVNSNVQLAVDEEQFTHQTVTRTRIPRVQSGGGGGGGGGHSGGSGVHTSSGGMSHGGGGHHF